LWGDSDCASLMARIQQLSADLDAAGIAGDFEAAAEITRELNDVLGLWFRFCPPPPPPVPVPVPVQPTPTPPPKSRWNRCRDWLRDVWPKYPDGAPIILIS